MLTILSYSSLPKKHLRIRKLLQRTVDYLAKCTNKTGFRISHEKSTIMHVYRKRSHGNIPPLLIENEPVSEVKTQRILGIIFDRRLNFHAHISKLKSDIEPRINILRAISGSKIGGHPKSLLNIYKSIARSKLLFGFPVFCGASLCQLKKLEPCHNKAIRLALGAFPTSPTKSIMAISGILPLQYTFWECLLKHLTTTTTTGDNSSVHSTSLKLAKEISLNQLGYRIPKIAKTHHSWSWEHTVPRVCWKLKELGGRNTSPTVARTLLSQLQREDFVAEDHIFTDGSKKDKKVGAAIVCNDTISNYGLPSETTIFSAEAYAIMRVVTMPTTNDRNRRVIFSDSESVITAVQYGVSTHPWIKVIRELLIKDQSTTLCWIPGHKGIPGNEQADTAAKDALDFELERIAIPPSDVRNELVERILNKWRNEWWTQQIHANGYLTEIERKREQSLV